MGETHYTIDQVPLRSYRGEKIAEVSQVNIEILRWDLQKNNSFTNFYRHGRLTKILQIFKKAGRLFAEEKIRMGSETLGPQDYAEMYSLSTGSPISVPLGTLERFRDTFGKIGEILESQALDGDIDAYEKGYVNRRNKKIGWVPRGRNLCVVTPSNHPAVHLLWSIACAMGYPMVLRPSPDDVFTPLRLVHALIEAGLPSSSFYFCPSPNAMVGQIIPLCDLAVIFGGDYMKKNYGRTSSIKVFGPGRSKIIVGDDCADRIDEVVDLAVSSMLKDGGRGCINLSAVITTRHAGTIAEAIASRIADIEPTDPLDETAVIGAHKDPYTAMSINSQIESAIHANGSIDATALVRKSPRVIEAFGTTFLLPTVILCNGYLDPLFGKEFPFPYITVAEVKREEVIRAASGSLVVTLFSEDPDLFRDLLFCPHISKVYHGLCPTTDIDFQEPHEGFISDFLFTTKAIRGES